VSFDATWYQYRVIEVRHDFLKLLILCFV